MTFTPSHYQKAIFDLVWSNNWKNIVVDACAGSGKTTTGIKTYDFFPQNADIMFTAFNTSTEANLLAKGTTALTYHKLGKFGITNAFGYTRIDKDKIYKLLPNYLNREQYGFLYYPIKKLVSLCKNCLIDPNPDSLLDLSIYHNIDLYPDQPELAEIIFDGVQWAMKKSAEITSLIDFDDMIWMPVYMNLPIHRYDILLVDEVQDTNASQLELAVRSGERIIGLGDPNQCQPAGTKVLLEEGKEIDISEIRPGMRVISYDRHAAAMVGRMKNKGKKILAVKKEKYHGIMHEINTGDHRTQCTANHKWLTRFNTRKTGLYVTYLMQRGPDFRVGWCQLFTTIGLNHLAERARIERAEKAWILRVFEDKASASLYENEVSAIYGITTAMFRQSSGNILYTQKNLDQLFKDLQRKSDPYSRSALCLKVHNRDIDYPFYNQKKQKRQGRTTLFITEACNLLPEIMSIPVYADNKVHWQPITSNNCYHDSIDVYSLNVETHEMYVADGLITHNSIYGFRGADTEAMPKLIERLNATVLPLSITYRNPRNVVNMVNTKYPDIKFEAADWAIDGNVSDLPFKQFIDTVQPGDMSLCRTNAPMVECVFQLIKQGRKAILLGRDIGDGLSTLVKRMKTNDLPEFYRKLAEHVDREVYKLAVSGKDTLAALMLDKRDCILAMSEGCASVDELINRIQTIFSDEKEGIVFSSIHKAKGLEAKNVFILHPELMPHPRARQSWEKKQEKNIGYVAHTRALENLTFVEG